MNEITIISVLKWKWMNIPLHVCGVEVGVDFRTKLYHFWNTKSKNLTILDFDKHGCYNAVHVCKKLSAWFETINFNPKPGNYVKKTFYDHMQFLNTCEFEIFQYKKKIFDDKFCVYIDFSEYYFAFWGDIIKLKTDANSFHTLTAEQGEASH